MKDFWILDSVQDCEEYEKTKIYIFKHEMHRLLRIIVLSENEEIARQRLSKLLRG